MFARVLPVLLLPLLPLLAVTGEMATNIATVVNTPYTPGNPRRPFKIVGQVTSVSSSLDLIVRDGTGAMRLLPDPERMTQHPTVGDWVEMSGYSEFSPEKFLFNYWQSSKTLGKSPVPEPIAVRGYDILEGRYDNILVSIDGRIRDAGYDEIDSRYITLLLSCDGQEIIVYHHLSPGETPADYEPLVGRLTTVTGICTQHTGGFRFFRGRHLNIAGHSAIKTLDDAPSDLFAAPDLSALTNPQHIMINSLGYHRTCGRVIATWGDSYSLLQITPRILCKIKVRHNELPQIGSVIEAVGLPETDFYTINLVRAIWRPIPAPPATNETTVAISGPIDNTDHKFALTHYGKHIRVQGRLMPATTLSAGFRTIYLENGNLILPVSIRRDWTVPEPGSILDVTGVCVVNTWNWHPAEEPPHLDGFLLAVGNPDDIRIAAHAPWWTPMRFLFVLGSLVAVLFAILLWNIALRRAAARKGLALLTEQIGRVESDLKTEERTRLAIELHDALSQTLACVAMELKAVAAHFTTNPERAAEHLGIADKSLLSCRQELRNCLQDLRSDALGETDINEAIRMTLGPYGSGANVVIRFNVLRERLTDNTTHALLRIIRELVMNAVNHGHATDIKIAGTIEDEKLLFSVRDNGLGFDPNNHPGVRQGHFGLQGIRERIQSYEGTFIIESSPGHGVRAAIALNLPHKET